MHKRKNIFFLLPSRKWSILFSRKEEENAATPTIGNSKEKCFLLLLLRKGGNRLCVWLLLNPIFRVSFLLVILLFLGLICRGNGGSESDAHTWVSPGKKIRKYISFLFSLGDQLLLLFFFLQHTTQHIWEEEGVSFRGITTTSPVAGREGNDGGGREKRKSPATNDIPHTRKRRQIKNVWNFKIPPFVLFDLNVKQRIPTVLLKTRHFAIGNYFFVIFSGYSVFANVFFFSSAFWRSLHGYAIRKRSRVSIQMRWHHANAQKVWNKSREIYANLIRVRSVHVRKVRENKGRGGIFVGSVGCVTKLARITRTFGVWKSQWYWYNIFFGRLSYLAAWCTSLVEKEALKGKGEEKSSLVLIYWGGNWRRHIRPRIEFPDFSFDQERGRDVKFWTGN